MCSFNNHRSAGPMARRLTTNQEIAGSIPASINIQLLLSEGISLLLFLHTSCHDCAQGVDAVL
jgi:hypothetical protein